MTWNRAAALLLTTSLVFSVGCEGTLTGNTTCGSVGQRSRVTCHFSQDINTVQGVTGIVLQRQSITNTSSLPDFVAECHKVNGDPFMCMNKPGYRVRAISDVMAVDILTEDADHEGRYSCILLPERLITYSESQHCVLKVTAAPDAIKSSTVCEVGRPTRDEQNTVSCQFSVDITKVKDVTGIVLFRHPLSDPNSLPDVVAECHRINGDPFMCIRKSGYRFRGDISNVTVVEILERDSEHEGRYSCMLLPGRLFNFTERKHCIINFNANVDTPTAIYVESVEGRNEEGRNISCVCKCGIPATATTKETASGGNNFDARLNWVTIILVGLVLACNLAQFAVIIFYRHEDLRLKQRMAGNGPDALLPKQDPDSGGTPTERSQSISLKKIRSEYLRTPSETQVHSKSSSRDTGIDLDTEENGQPLLSTRQCRRRIDQLNEEIWAL